MFEAVRRHAFSRRHVLLVDDQRDRLAAPHPDRPNAPLDRDAQDATLKSFGQDLVTQQHHLEQPLQFEGRQQRIARPGHKGLAID